MIDGRANMGKTVFNAGVSFCSSSFLQGLAVYNWPHRLN